AGAGEGNVRVDRKGGQRPIEVGPGDAEAATAVRRFGGARVTHEQEFAVQLEGPSRQGRAQPRYRSCAHADLSAAGSNQRIHLVRRLSGGRVHAYGGPSRVV